LGERAEIDRIRVSLHLAEVFVDSCRNRRVGIPRGGEKEACRIEADGCVFEVIGAHVVRAEETVGEHRVRLSVGDGLEGAFEVGKGHEGNGEAKIADNPVEDLLLDGTVEHGDPFPVEIGNRADSASAA